MAISLSSTLGTVRVLRDDMSAFDYSNSMLNFGKKIHLYVG